MQKVLLIIPWVMPSNSIGCITPLLELHKAGHIEFRMQYYLRRKEKDVEWADTVVLCRTLEPDALEIISWVLKHNKRLVYDIDDNFFELPLDNPQGLYARSPAHLFTINKMFEQADAVRVYSQPLFERARKSNPNTKLLNSYFRADLIKGLNRRSHDKIRIVYATSRVTDDVLYWIYIGAVRRILCEFRDKVEFYAYGQIPYELKDLPNVRKCKYEPQYSKYIRSFYEMGFDIGLAPAEDTVVCNSKSNNKFREYGAMEVCGIYSNTLLYNTCVENEVTGILADNSEESWYQALRNLIENQNLREKIKENAKKVVLTEYSLAKTLDDWKMILSLRNDQKPAFYNFRYLNILTVFEKDCMEIRVRMNAYLTLMGLYGINYNPTAIDNFNRLYDRKKYDCVVLFLRNLNRYQVLQKQLAEEDIMVFIDSFYPDQAEWKNDRTVIINEADNSLIPNRDILLNNPYNNDDLMLFLSAVLQQEQCEMIDVRNKKEKQSLYLEYSENSPIYKWAELLSQIPVTEPEMTRQSIIGKAAHKFVNKTRDNRISRYIKKKKFQWSSRASKVWNMSKDYWQINHKHKY